MGDAQGPVLEAVRRHLERHLGRGSPVDDPGALGLPTGGASAEPPTFTVHRFLGTGTDPTILATTGASLAPMPDGRRAEVVVIAHLEPPHFQPMLELIRGAVARFHDVGARLNEVIPAPASFASATGMEGAIVLPPMALAESIATVEVPTLGIVHIFWLYPIYRAEAELVLLTNARTLLNFLSAAGIDMFAFPREPLSHSAGGSARSSSSDDSGRSLTRPEIVENREGTDVVVRKRGAQASDSGWPRRRSKVDVGASADPQGARPRPKPRPLFPGAEPEPTRFELPPALRRTRKAAPKLPYRRRGSSGAVKPEAQQDSTPTTEGTAHEELTRKQRIEALKAAARAAEERAAERSRKGQRTASKSTRSRPDLSTETAQQAKAASERRGAPKEAIRNQIQKQTRKKKHEDPDH